MPQARKTSDEIFPMGRHLMKLDCVEEAVIEKSNFPNRPDGGSDVWYWRFTAKSVTNEYGEPMGLRHMTDPKLTPNNKTTKFWKQMQPLTGGRPTSYEDISGDTAELEGRWYWVHVTHETKGDKTFANIGFIEPYVAKPKGDGAAATATVAPIATTRPQAPATPAPAPDLPEEDIDDPFEDE